MDNLSIVNWNGGAVLAESLAALAAGLSWSDRRAILGLLRRSLQAALAGGR